MGHFSQRNFWLLLHFLTWTCAFQNDGFMQIELENPSQYHEWDAQREGGYLKEYQKSPGTCYYSLGTWPKPRGTETSLAPLGAREATSCEATNCREIEMMKTLTRKAEFYTDRHTASCGPRGAQRTISKTPLFHISAEGPTGLEAYD